MALTGSQHLDIWPQIVVLYWEGVESLEKKACLVELGDWGQDFESYNPAPLKVYLFAS